MAPRKGTAEPRDSDPNRPHPFRDTNDAGLGAFASGGGQWQGSQVDMLGVTTGYLRATRCAMPGCGKARQDPIHRPADS